ncbi:MAG: phage holin family protein [Propionibacteriaceae bacterium]|jgi:hypothetical protein|nr:phage holin family protein [Propionibacteriaceae bacterium]
MADSFGTLIKDIQEDVHTIIHGEIELVKAELIPQAKSAGLGAGLFGGAGYLAMVGLGLLFMGVGFGCAWFYSGVCGLGWAPAAFLGFVTGAVLALLVAGALALLGKAQLKFGPPQAAIDSVNESVAAVRDSVQTTTKQIAERPLVARRDQSAG